MPAVRLEPVCDLCQGLGAQPIPAALPVRADLDEAGFPQHLEVLGDSRLAEADARDELGDRPLTVAQEVEDLATGWFRERRVGRHELILPNRNMSATNHECYEPLRQLLVPSYGAPIR